MISKSIQGLSVPLLGQTSMYVSLSDSLACDCRLKKPDEPSNQAASVVDTLSTKPADAVKPGAKVSTTS